MSYSNWSASTRPKVQGTINLHKALANAPLDFFIMTSSVSGILGTPGQSNYAAANTFIDSFARHRVWKGQKATSLILSMVLGVGYVAEHAELEETIKSKGIYGIDEEDLLQSFEVSLVLQGSKGSADHVVLGMNPARLQNSVIKSSATDAFWIDNARFKTINYILKSGRRGGDDRGSDKTMLSTIRSAATQVEAVKLVSDYFVEKLSRALLVASCDFEPDAKPIADYGLDSMIGADIRNWIFKELGLDISFQKLLGPSFTIAKFAYEVWMNNERLKNDAKIMPQVL